MNKTIKYIILILSIFLYTGCGEDGSYSDKMQPAIKQLIQESDQHLDNLLFKSRAFTNSTQIDWDHIDPIGNNGDKVLKVYSDEDYVYFLISSKSSIEPNTILLIDSDNDSSTGYQSNRWSKTGFDFIVGTNGTLYASKTNNSSFSIENIGMSVSYTKNHNDIEIKIDKSDLDLDNSFGVAVQSYDNSWNMSISIPSNNIITHYPSKIDNESSPQNSNNDKKESSLIIKLNGTSNITLNQGEIYNELGASADDDSDDNISIKTIGKVNTSKPGIYTITYTATDSLGNSASIKRTVTVKIKSVNSNSETKDWDHIDPIGNNGDKVLKVYSDEDYVYFLISSKSSIEPNTILLIDSDNDSSTGYQSNRWSKTGFDFIVGTNGTLYASKTNNSSFSVRTISISESYMKSSTSIEIKIDKSDLDLDDSFGVAVQSYDNSWNMSISIPSNNIIAHYSYQTNNTSSTQNSITQDTKLYILDGKKVPNIVLHDDIPEGAYYQYIYDQTMQENILELHTDGIKNSFHILGYDVTHKYEWITMENYQNKFILNWDSKFDEDFIIYVVLKFTTEDNKTIYSDLVYTPNDRGYTNYTESFMQISLGTDAKDGRWHHYKRNILDDLRKYYPNARIDFNNFNGYINGFAVRGSGKIANITLSQ